MLETYTYFLKIEIRNNTKYIENLTIKSLSVILYSSSDLRIILYLNINYFNQLFMHVLII